MKTNHPHHTRGAVPALLLIPAALAALYLYAFGPKLPTLPGHASAPAAALQANEAQASTNTTTAATARASEAKTGQQLTAAAAALDQSPATDPGAKLAREILPRANNALENGLGPLTPEQAAWVQTLVANALSAQVEKVAAAQAALTASDQARAAAEERARAADADNQKLTTERKTLTAALVAHDAAAGATWFWIKAVALAAFFALYILPLLAKVFPQLGALETAAHAIIAPLAAKAWGEAKALATDASGAVCSVLAKVEKEAPAAFQGAKAEADAWLTEADGTAARYAAALRKSNLL